MESETSSSSINSPGIEHEQNLHVFPAPNDDLPFADLAEHRSRSPDPPGAYLPVSPFSRRRVETAADMSPPATVSFSALSDPVRILRTCLEKIPTWSQASEEEVEVNHIMAGLTNQLFNVVVRNEMCYPKQVLFRIYGESVSELYDPKFEQQTFKNLSNLKIAPRLIAKFPGGRIEQWINGDPIPVLKLTLPSILSAVGTILARFHRVVKDHGENFLPKLPRPFPTESTMWSTLDKYSSKCYAILSSLPTSDPKYPALLSLDIPFRMKQAKWLRGEVDRLAKEGGQAYDIVFCHNDVQENNILKVDGHYLRIIDFEYSNFNYAGCDVANFFNETMLNYCGEEYPFFTFDATLYPDLEHRRFFAASYLSAVLDESIMPSHEKVDPFLEAVEVLGCMTAMMWGFWGVIRTPQAPTAEEFDFLQFAAAEFRILDDRVSQLRRQGVVTPIN